MKIIQHILFSVALVLTGANFALAGDTLDRVKEAGVLKVATDADWAPQSFLNDDNEMDGFDVDVAKEIAKRMGIEIEFVTPDWTVITSGNWAGRWDISVGSMTPTAERAQVLEFPGIYYYTPASFAVHNDSSAQSKVDLNGKKIGACTACTYEFYLQHDLNIDAEGAPPFSYDVTPGEIVSMEDPAILFDNLRLGDGVRLDGMIDSLPAIRSAIENGAPIRVLGTPAFYEPLAIAIDRGDKEFHHALKDIVQLMHRDGTLSRLSEKWYGIDYSKSSN
ncbi:MAG: transporter substrate-binding domain-containing protein [Hyphomicrobiales bacterium]|nr:transporter substrate-binding domain-containing protein [Hyphomicrobiales bacterium]MCY4032929.1 transporter substrate-binding domain-containing protein [Hyphomicrobiales bacterium]MCY4038667.1 transporter substrate-binding domain-containing protein [Hyphomicrobiales bacterium]